MELQKSPQREVVVVLARGSHQHARYGSGAAGVGMAGRWSARVREEPSAALPADTKEIER